MEPPSATEPAGQVKQKRPRVLTLFPSAVGGGAERMVLEQIRRSDRFPYAHEAIALRKADLHDAFAAFPSYSCAHAPTRFSPLALRRIHRAIAAHGIDILHTHLQEADFYGFWLKKLNPRLVWISSRQNTDRFRQRLFWRTLNRAISQRTDRVIAASGAVRDFVGRYEGIPPEKVTVVWNAINLGRFAAVPPRPEARASFGLPPDAFVVGIVGRLSPQKGHRYLFEAAARLAPDIPELRLLVVGKGHLGGKLRRLARALGIADRVSFVGFHENMATAYAAMDVFCMPSLFEGLPLALLEALVCEKVAVAARAPGITDVITDGKNGLLVDVADPAGLAAALLRVRRGEYDPEMVRRARAAALAEYDVEKYLSRLEAVYFDLSPAERALSAG
jgi:glycosyltransferase involved in cell wall biosynthesis